LKTDYTIASGTCFYNDCKSLERTLESLKDKMDIMICVDGRFKHYRADTPLSNDGSRELVESYDNAVLLDVPDAYEIQKRQAYVDFCTKRFDNFQPMDYLLIVDSDEYVLECDRDVWDRELVFLKTGDNPYHQYNIFAVMLEINSGKYQHIVHEFVSGQPPQVSRDLQFAHSPRLWHRPYEVEYNITHYQFRHKHPSSSLYYQETNCAVKIVDGMKLGHDHVLRDDKHLYKRKEYQRWLVSFEQDKLLKWQQRNKLTPKIHEYDSIDCNQDADKSTG